MVGCRRWVLILKGLSRGFGSVSCIVNGEIASRQSNVDVVVSANAINLSMEWSCLKVFPMFFFLSSFFFLSFLLNPYIKYLLYYCSAAELSVESTIAVGKSQALLLYCTSIRTHSITDRLSQEVSQDTYLHMHTKPYFIPALTSSSVSFDMWEKIKVLNRAPSFKSNKTVRIT